MEVQGLLDVHALWEAVILPHEVGQGVVPVGGSPLGEEHRVVEVQLLVASQFLRDAIRIRTRTIMEFRYLEVVQHEFKL